MINDFIFPIIGTVIAIAGFVGTNLWNNRNRKDKIVETRQSMQADVESTAREKLKQEHISADALSNQNKMLALEVKQNMKDHIDNLIVVLKQDIELQRISSYARMDMIEQRSAQIKIDLMQHIIDEKDERVRMQRAIDFLQTMQYGPEAKSIPDYLIGEEESQEHKDEPEKGVFASRKDTTHKDTKDPPLE